MTLFFILFFVINVDLWFGSLGLFYMMYLSEHQMLISALDTQDQTCPGSRKFLAPPLISIEIDSVNHLPVVYEYPLSLSRKCPANIIFFLSGMIEYSQDVTVTCSFITSFLSSNFRRLLLYHNFGLSLLSFYPLPFTFLEQNGWVAA